MGAAGRRVALINVPLTYPPTPVNGIMVTGMLTPPGADLFTYPPSLSDELRDRYRIDVSFVGRKDSFTVARAPDRGELLRELIQVERERGEVALELLRRERWDLFTVIFTGTDRLQHFFWEEIESGDGGEFSPLLDAFWRMLDEQVGRLADAVGEGSSVLLVSDHGFGPAPRYWVHVNRLLEDAGLLRLKGLGGTSWKNPTFWKRQARKAGAVRRWAKRLLPSSFQDTLRRKERVADAIDWERTVAVAQPLYSFTCGIRLVGSAGEGRKETLGRVLRVVMQWEHMGKPMVEEVYRREELFSGPYASKAPDLILVMRPEYSCVESLGGAAPVEPSVPFRSGDHRREGIFLACGEAFPPGRISEPLRIEEMAPLLMWLAGLPVPEGMDAGVPVDILRRETLAEKPVRVGPIRERDLTQPVPHGLTPEEESALEEHLRGLGYL
jgi:predicted AlkP superfamily phosphohydrolase/phosphomutase